MVATRTVDVEGPWDQEDTALSDWREQFKAEQEALDALLKVSRELPEGEVVGAVIRFQKGDGYAFYRVESARPLKLAWIPFLDKWQISDAELRGLRLVDVKNLVEGERRIAALFSRPIS